MSTPPRLRVVSQSPASRREIETGLLAWLRVEIPGLLVLDGLTLRRTVDGSLTISFPRRADLRGRWHPLIQPVDAAARREIERIILPQLEVGRRESEVTP